MLAAAPIWTYEFGTIAELITAGVAICAFCGAVVQLRQTRRTTLETRAHEYLRRYDAPRLLPYIDRAHTVVGSKEPSAQETRFRLRAWERLSFRDRLDVLVMLNFWEELAGMYNRDLVDKKIIDEYFGDAALEFWKRSLWLQHHLQEQQAGEAVYNEWQEMCCDLVWQRRVRRSRVRDGCLP